MLPTRIVLRSTTSPPAHVAPRAGRFESRIAGWPNAGPPAGRGSSLAGPAARRYRDACDGPAEPVMSRRYVLFAAVYGSGPLPSMGCG